MLEICRLSFPLRNLSFPISNSEYPFPYAERPFKFLKFIQIRSEKKAKRTGRLRYPSEKKKLMPQQQNQTDVKGKIEGIWRISNLAISVHEDPGKDHWEVSEALLQEIAKVLEFPVASMLPAEAFTVIRKSFDARKLQKEPKFVYTVHMDVNKLLSLEPRTLEFISELEPKIGHLEFLHDDCVFDDLMSTIVNNRKVNEAASSTGVVHRDHVMEAKTQTIIEKPKVVIVGSGPSGLFAALVLGELGADVTLVERGQAVEQRGRDIGALVVRRKLQLESNFCFGEGGAGTWSDGKLVTRIGRNNSSVITVLKTLVHFGAPYSILVDGKPHLGTDRLIPLLRGFRLYLQKLGVGLRIEHPQELIDDIQYSGLAGEVQRGRGKVPVADYQVAEYVTPKERNTTSNFDATGRSCYSFCMCPGGQVVLTSTDPSEICINGMSFSRRSSRWANAALVVTVSSKDLEALNFHGPLAGVQFQRMFERKAAVMGGGSFVVPVQKVTNFLDHRLSGTSLPPSSYRLGVKPACLHELFPIEITEALQNAILMFDKELPGFVSDNALLHGVETRTSSPIQITRKSDTLESTSLKGMYPIGEGAGFAGGIVSAAVDGMHAGFAIAKNLGLYTDDIESIMGKAPKPGFVKY
ncbi:uncharacterized protein [Primulina huaijiensis]|uniref:uncharacterized protein isoform X2 n=1 Tax=Primulina huaijiensis TaxID=1492673 RepID=UPI003CC78E94